MKAESASSSGPFYPPSIENDTVSNVFALPVVQNVAFSFHSDGQRFFFSVSFIAGEGGKKNL